MSINMSLKRRSATQRKRNGQGLLEFALVLPILLMLIFGIIDLGWMAFNFSQLYNGTREGARFGSVPGFNLTPQYVDCAGIKNTIIRLAGFSGIKAGDIRVYYDDGRPISTDTLPASGPYPAVVVGTCDSAFAYNTAYTEEGSGTPRNRGAHPLTGQKVYNGDRVVIEVNVNVQFLTPFFKSMVPSGLNMKFRTARSVFPGGLAA